MAEPFDLSNYDLSQIMDPSLHFPDPSPGGTPVTPAGAPGPVPAVAPQHVSSAGAPRQIQRQPQQIVAPGHSPLQGRIEERGADADATAEALRAKYAGQEQAYGGMQQGESAIKQLLHDTRARIDNLKFGPDKWDRFAAVMGAFGSADPRRGGIAAAAGAGATEGAAQNQLTRQGELTREQLKEKYEIEEAQHDQLGRQYGLAAQQAGISGLQTRYNADESAIDRATIAQGQQDASALKSPVVNINGMATPNQALIQAQGQTAGAKKAAEMQAQMANVDPDTLDMVKAMIRRTGSVPYSIARGNPMLGSIGMRAVRQDLREEGKDPNQWITLTQLNKADQLALGQLEKTGTLVGTYEKTANSLADMIQNLNGKVDRTGSPILNKGLQHWRTRVTSDPDTASFVNLMTDLQSDYAKVMSGAYGAAAPTDEGIKRATQLFSTVQDVPTLNAAINTAREAMGQRKQNFVESRHELQHMMETGEDASDTGSSSSSSSGLKSKSGRTIVADPSAPSGYGYKD